MHAQTKSTATAFAIHPISSRRILTNAHAVANQIQVQLRKHGSARKFPARVVAVGHEVSSTVFGIIKHHSCVHDPAAGAQEVSQGLYTKHLALVAVQHVERYTLLIVLVAFLAVSAVRPCYADRR
jgi:hypothetical protein